jgi:hypothetical protein
MLGFRFELSPYVGSGQLRMVSEPLEPGPQATGSVQCVRSLCLGISLMFPLLGDF